MGVEPGEFSVSAMKLLDRERLLKAIYAFSGRWKKIRKHKRRKRKKEEDNIKKNKLNRVPLRNGLYGNQLQGKRRVLLGGIDRQNSSFRTAKTIIIKFGLQASFLELESAKNALNEVEGYFSDIDQEQHKGGYRRHIGLWKAYDCLEDEGFFYLSVNHIMFFKDPETGAHTNSIQQMERFIQTT
ncbi:hypothetical protein TNCV_2694801 [Trichonephila clavipes]|nr:hypothetical protein TNCV_2694801 [Trichonephila clavipes]